MRRAVGTARGASDSWQREPGSEPDTIGFPAPTRKALELVRGEPLTGTALEYSWAHLDTHAIAQEIADAAHELATQYLKTDRPGDARWAAEQGLRADPYLEALYRDLMEAAAASGSLAEVEAIMNRLRKVVADDATDNDADDRLDPATVRLVAELRPTRDRRGEAG